MLKQAGDQAGAVLSLQGAVDVLEEMRRNIEVGDHRESFLNTRFDPYKEIVALLYESLGETRQALSYVDRAKSITLKEYLRLDSRSVATESSLAVDSTLVTLEYFFTKDKLLIFTSGRDGFHCASQAVSREEAEQQVRELLESISKNDMANFAALSRRLYDELLAPVEKDILAADSRSLVILPDGPLHLLPFAALQDSNGRFVIEKAAIAFAPSRSVLSHCLSRGRAADLSGSHSILLIDGSATLASARRELEHLLQLYGKDARVAAPQDVASYRQLAAGSEILHFAGHSVIREGKPVLMLRSIPSEIYLDTQVIGASRIARSRLVCLAGCSTAVGPISEGETPWGLIPAFLNAGAPAIVASLLPVDDSSTEALTSCFYELLKKGCSKSESLRRAQLALLDVARSSGCLRPQSWTPYILVGDPR